MTEILIGDFVLLLFIFLRIIAMIVTAPVLSHTAFPTLGKLFLAMVIAYMVFLTIDKSKTVVDVNLISIAVNGAREVLVGMMMGYMLTFLFHGITFAGSLIGYDMGLMMAEVMNPLDNTSSNVVGEVIYYVSLMIFFLINGHHYIIGAVVASFNVIPLTEFTMTFPVLQVIIKYSFAVFIIAIKIASPVLVSFFLIHIAEGIISRVIPNIQVFFVTQPAKIGIGFLFLSALAPIYVFAIKNLLQNYESHLSEMIKAMGT
ncbi:MAG: flagellar biosynthetic protein FliR [Ignavibacteriae bacterium HGW-Ignavibacteriae-3]|nr:MAG: flagellar biosynthetic protein FliR [Ignavibacteriae bacterium HGW-Ignavibacteriae-3]